MRTLFPVALLSLFLAAVPTWGQAEEPPEQPREPPPPEQLAREGVEKLLRALDAFIQMIPQYEMPELNENGDIIIRRKRDGAPAKPGEDPNSDEDDQTST